MGTTLVEALGSHDNLDEPPGLLNHPQNIIAITVTFMVLTWICALFRLYTRFFIIRSPGWDDFFIILSLLSTSTGSISICVATTRAGMGQHFILLSRPIMIEYLKILYVNYVANATYPGSAGYIKLALLFQYLRIYEKGTRLRMATIVTIVVVTLWCLAYSILAWMPTIPVQAYWNLEMPATRYAFGALYVEPFVEVYMNLTGTNMVLDMIILGLAVPLLVNNNKTESKKSRWAVCTLFIFGSMASIFSIWRLAAIVQTRATTFPTFDPTWYGTTPIILAALEVDTATICAALPVFWPVLRQLSINQILVTREVNVTLEHRNLSTGGTTRASNDPDDDGIELQSSESGLQFTNSKRDHYEDPYVVQQVNPFRGQEFGTKAEIGSDAYPVSVKKSASVTRFGTSIV